MIKMTKEGSSSPNKYSHDKGHGHKHDNDEKATKTTKKKLDRSSQAASTEGSIITLNGIVISMSRLRLTKKIVPCFVSQT